MKRFLSIVLIAAAVFGIYNYYVNIMDVFACKTYWEEKSSDAEDTLNALGAALNKLKRNKKTYTSGQKQLTKGEKSLAANEGKYYQAGGQLSSIKKQISSGESAVSELTQMINAISKVRAEYKTWKTHFDTIHKEREAVVKSLDGPDPDGRDVKTLLREYADYLKDATAYTSAIDRLDSENKEYNSRQRQGDYKLFATDCHTVATTVDSLRTNTIHLYKSAKVIATYDKETLYDALNNDSSQELYDDCVNLLMMTLFYDDEEDAREAVDMAKEDDELSLQEIIDAAKSGKAELYDLNNSLKWVQHYVTKAMKNCTKHITTYVDNLASTQESIAVGVQNIAKAILSDSTMKKYAVRAMGSKAVSVLEIYAKDPSPLSTSTANFLSFEKQMDSNPGLDKSLEKAQKYLTTQKTSASKSLSSAKTKYKNALKSYNATPKKLETARKKLDNIKKKLAQFESSEKELEKGLNELANTEANGDLKSIRDRLGGKVKFTDKKGHIDINKGFDAVDAGEAYLNEQGDLIKNEITGRIIATVMGVISAVLALLAALLSLFRSNRGAAIIACISAVMAAGAAALGSGTSSVYSELAGSHVGNAPWMAAAIIAGVAMVFSVTHFAAKVEDPLTEEE